jgi:hypothetical protein
MSRHKPQAGLARELVDAIDALVSFVKKNEGREFTHSEWTRDNLHVLGAEVQTLAEELGLASPGEPVYSTAERYGVYLKLGKGDLLSGETTTNPTWPGEAYTVRPILGSPSLTFFLRPSMAWYKRFKTLREKALEMCGSPVAAGGDLPTENRDGFLGAMHLAKMCKVPKKRMAALHKRLERFRNKHGHNPKYVVSVEAPGPREARYLHAVKHVLPEIKDLGRP